MTGETINQPSADADLVSALAKWLGAHIEGARDVVLRNVTEPTQGFSSKTILFTALWQNAQGPQRRDLVARIQREVGCPMLADVFHQYRVMRAISSVSTVAVPRLAFAEVDPAPIGQPFFVMERVEGRVPADIPSYHEAGWFADELTTGQRAQAWWNAIREMERLHRIDWRVFPFLGEGLEAAPRADFYLEGFIGAWMDWAAQGQSYPAIERAIRLMTKHMPPTVQTGLVWNDARMGNTMFAPDFTVAALIDFEVATLGPAEIDLAWWLYSEEIHTVQYGTPRIAGVPMVEDAVTGMELIYGRAMPDMDYFLAVAALKHVILSIRDYSNGKIMEQAMLPDFALERLSTYLNSYLKRNGI